MRCKWRALVFPRDGAECIARRDKCVSLGTAAFRMRRPTALLLSLFILCWVIGRWRRRRRRYAREMEGCFCFHTNSSAAAHICAHVCYFGEVNALSCAAEWCFHLMRQREKFALSAICASMRVDACATRVTLFWRTDCPTGSGRVVRLRKDNNSSRWPRSIESWSCNLLLHWIIPIK